jgi:hypothetical protein
LFLVEIIGLATQPSTDHLFAKKLSAEGADSENMCDRVGVPPLGQHRHGDHTTDRVAELPRFADRVHNLAQQVVVCDLLTGPDVACARHDFSAVPFNFVRRHIAEPFIERLTRFELFAIDQKGSWSGKPIAVLVVIAE